MQKLDGLIMTGEVKAGKAVIDKVNGFFHSFETFEKRNGVQHLLLLDKKSGAFYIVCHLDSKILASKTDSEAVLDPEESEDYKLNRGLYTDTYAYKLMESDAKQGRSFEDLVTEYDTSYRPEKPLKIFGGQHRALAIKESVKEKVSTVHGVRVYFGLSTQQRFEIASVNNTAIAVSNDLLDRMQEDSLGPELRKWCQTVGLLSEDQNFADRRSSEGILTVRIARSIIINFYRGYNSKLDDWHYPMVCASGPGIDEEYQVVRKKVNWNDKNLIEMGKQFARLHKTQREIVINRKNDKYMEFANKALHPTIASSWAYTSGLFQNNAENLGNHYVLVESTSPPNDPLNAKALVQARFKGVDPDTYRGLGSRISGDELGRMLQVFMLQATRAQKRGVSLKLANAAIETFEALKQQQRAVKAVEGI